MTDHLTPLKRSLNMSRINSKNTAPEKKLRSLLHLMGFRFRLHDKKLPGKPDIILPRYKTVIFMNGCFWHQHPGCRRSNLPKSNQEYWLNKLKRNVERDAVNIKLLETAGWKVLVIWECETKDIDNLSLKLRKFLT